MHDTDLSRASWRKSNHSSANGQCIEVADLGQDVAVRDSKDPAGPKLLFTHREWDSFLRSAGQTDREVL
jgi:hypothetical protein